MFLPFIKDVLAQNKGGIAQNKGGIDLKQRR